MSSLGWGRGVTGHEGGHGRSYEGGSGQLDKSLESREPINFKRITSNHILLLNQKLRVAECENGPIKIGLHCLKVHFSQLHTEQTLFNCSKPEQVEKFTFLTRPSSEV